MADEQDMALPSRRKDAKRAGGLFYFTGKACTHGHIAPRHTKSGTCVPCRAAFNVAFRDRNPGYTVGWNKRNPDKLRAIVARTNAKPETKAYRKKWRASNPDSVRASQARTNAKDPSYERLKRSRLKNPDATKRKAAAYSRKWRAANKEKYKSDRAAWESKNREVMREYCNQRRAKASKRLSRGLVYLLMQEQGGKCPYCSTDLRVSGHSIDHYMPLSLGGAHEDWNIQLTCGPCNSRKRSKHPAKFLLDLALVS